MNLQDNPGSGGQPAQPYGLNQPTEGNTAPYMDQLAEGNTVPYMDQPAEGNTTPYMDQPAEGNTVPYMDQPAEGNTAPYMNQQGAGYTGMQYRFDGSSPQYQQEQKNNRKKLGILIALIGVIIAAVAGIIVGTVMNRGGDSDDGQSLAAGVTTDGAREPVTGPAEPDGESRTDDGPQPTPEPAEPTAEPEPSPETTPVTGGEFETRASGTVRGSGIGFAYDDSHTFLKTAYGVCGIVKNSDGTYEFLTWVMAMNEGIRIKSLAFYKDYVYLACGENGLMRTDFINGDHIPQIVSGNITSFAIAEDKIFYIVVGDDYNSWGGLYMSDLDGGNSVLLDDNVIRAFMGEGSADFEYVDGYLYYLHGDGDLMRMRADGTGAETVVKYEDMDCAYKEGVYYNNGKIYMPGTGGIYAYDIASGSVGKVVGEDVMTYYPIVFAGDALLYVDEDWYWHHVSSGGDVKYPSEYNNGILYMEVVGGELFYLNVGDYYSVDYEGGVIRAENPIEIAYYDIPDLGQTTDAPKPDEGGGIPAVEEGAADFRASYIGYSADDYALIKNNQWDGNNLVCADDGGYFALSSKNVMYFQVIGDEVYYSVKNPKSQKYSFWRQKIERGSRPEKLLNGTQVCTFSYCDGLIYYDNYDDYYKLYCYDPATGTNEKISDDSVNYYYILEDQVYYECMNDGCLCRMKLDGTGRQELFSLSDFGAEYVQCLTAFRAAYDGEVYLAFNTSEYEMYLIKEDGSCSSMITDGLEDFDVDQDMYYADGFLYYSTDNSTRIHKLDTALYLENGQGSGTQTADDIISRESFVYFEVEDGLVYIELYGGSYGIKVIDCQTGESRGMFDYSAQGEPDV